MNWIGKHVRVHENGDQTVNSNITDQERQSLTVWGETFSAQIRPGGMALYMRPEAPRSGEDGQPYLLEHADVAKLRELLNEAAAR